MVYPSTHLTSFAAEHGNYHPLFLDDLLIILACRPPSDYHYYFSMSFSVPQVRVLPDWLSSCLLQQSPSPTRLAIIKYSATFQPSSGHPVHIHHGGSACSRQLGSRESQVVWVQDAGPAAGILRAGSYWRYMQDIGQDRKMVEHDLAGIRFGPKACFGSVMAGGW